MSEDHRGPFSPDEEAVAADLEPRPEESPTGPQAMAVWLMALFIALPLWIWLMIWFTPSFYRGNEFEESEGDGGSGAERPAFVIHGQADSLDFNAVQPFEQASSTEEILKNLLFTVKPSLGPMPRRLYLRSRTFEQFTANSMKSSLSETLDDVSGNVLAGEQPPIAANLNCEFHFFKNMEEVFAHPPTLHLLAGPVPFLPFKDGSIRFTQTLAAGDLVETESLRQSVLEASSRMAPAPDQRYLDPGVLDSAKMKDLAHSLTDSLPDPAQKALAIRSYIEKHSAYTMTPPPVTPGIHPVEFFLFGSHQGHCQSISAATAALCRHAGIPARVAGGYVAMRKNAEGDQFLVNATDGHAWAEILTDQGWAIFDVSVAARDQAVRQQELCRMPTTAETKKELAKAQASARRAPSQKNRTLARGAQNAAQRKAKSATPAKGQNPRLQPPQSPQEVLQSLKTQKQQEDSAWRKKILIMLLLLLAGYLCQRLKLFTRILGLLQKWLNKLLKQQKPDEETSDGKSPEEACQSLRQRLESATSLSLEGRDVIALFNAFFKAMGTLANLPRGEAETPHEYLTRLGETFPLAQETVPFLSGTFASCLYGRRNMQPATSARFCSALQNILKLAETRNSQRDQHA